MSLKRSQHSGLLSWSVVWVLMGWTLRSANELKTLNPKTNEVFFFYPFPYIQTLFSNFPIKGMSKWDPAPLCMNLSVVRLFITSLIEALPGPSRAIFVATHGSTPEDDASFVFWTVGILPVDAYRKYEILGMDSLEKRVEKVVGWIREITVR